MPSVPGQENLEGRQFQQVGLNQVKCDKPCVRGGNWDFGEWIPSALLAGVAVDGNTTNSVLGCDVKDAGISSTGRRRVCLVRHSSRVADITPIT